MKLRFDINTKSQPDPFIFDDNGNETVLTNITPRKLKNYLIGLQNYRAQYRPAGPPIHSEDDRHDLSPNAM